MGMGIPGSGKTAALKSFAAKNEYEYICPDDIRLELTGNAIDQTRNTEVWQRAYDKVAQALASKKDIVFDATFVDKSARLKFIEFARQNGVNKIQGFVTDVNYEVAQSRNLNRDRVVPEYAMERMYLQLSKNPPELEEGFDSIFTIDENQNIKSVEIS